MTMKLSPKTKRNISRVIPFGIIWVLSGWVFIISDSAATRNINLNPDTDIAFTIPVLIIANIANVIVGLLVGVLEVVYLEKRFVNHSLLSKFFQKFAIYLLFFLVMVVIFYPLAYLGEVGADFELGKLLPQMGRFFASLTFVITIFQLSVSLFLALIYSAVSENLGHQVFLNFFTGKYHKPVVEERIFMFLDMKSSTTIAESLGHVKYFKLLQDYYNIMSDPIINSKGEVYQYIGDEIVISWKLKDGIEENNCINCFFEIQKKLEAQQQKMLQDFGFGIGFKAGVHFGEVTIGEIGALKKEIVFSGDVLNTTARIQSMCNELQSDLLVSGELKKLLGTNEYKFTSKGELELKGREKKEELFDVSLKI